MNKPPHLRQIPHTDADRSAMLERIGMDESALFADSPAGRFDRTWRAASEQEILGAYAPLARPVENPRAGGGHGGFAIPAVVDHLASRGEFVTSYTPYQPECSQGTLGAIFEFQTRICELTALEISNAGLYDGSTALAEAISMATAETGRRRVILSRAILPAWREVARTLLAGRGLEFVEVGFDRATGESLLPASSELEGAACCVLQSPNAFGVIESRARDHFAAARASGAVPIHAFHPLAAPIVGRSGELGAEIAVADGQSLGVPLWGGGPWLGLIAASQRFIRRMPGRIVGETRDRDGRPCFVLTLQAREQHIRRERATSNICTNQALIALRATIFLAALGWEGLAILAASLQGAAKKAATGRAIFTGEVFNEFTVLGDEGVWLDYPELGTVSAIGVSRV